MLQDMILLKNIKHLAHSGADKRISAVGCSVIPGSQRRLRGFFPQYECAYGNAASQRFCAGHDIRLHTVRLPCKISARPAHTALDLVEDQDNVFLITDFAEPLKEAWFRRVDMFVTPLFDLIRPVPTIAWIPLMILWFGIGLGAKAAIIFVSAFVPCVINAYSGIKQTKPVHLWVAQTFGASRREMLFTVAIPTALPMIFTGLRISLGTAWMTLCAAEMLASNKGLGYMIQVNRSLARADLIVVAMLVIGLIGTIFTVVLNELEHRCVKGGRRG